MNNKIIDKNYGSIPHLSTSKLTQQADKKIQIGQENILNKKARDWKDLVIVTEKLDGSNVGVIRKNNEIKTITRKGYDCSTSPHHMHEIFSLWVDRHLSRFWQLPEGWRITGEWLMQAHGTIYDLQGNSPFVAFDIFDDKNNRVPYLKFIEFCHKHMIQTVPLLHIGQPVSIKNCIKLLGKGHYGEGIPEGFVMRCEREGNVDFLAKWVRADKEDGKYLREDDPVWNKGFKI